MNSRRVFPFQRLLLLGGALLLGLIAACSNTSNSLRSAPKFYPTARENYEFGQREMRDRNWDFAAQYFNHIKATFGFSKWATLAELGLANANMGREKYTEAIDQYRAFVKAHPNHEHVQDGYAAFKVGEAFYKQIPSDWFLIPPSYEKDQGPVEDALRELDAYKEQYGDSPYLAQAKKMIADCLQRLADHEIYVAEFYMKHDHPASAAARLEGALKNYPGAGREPATLLLLGKTYLAMDNAAAAKVAFNTLINRYPDDFRAEKAKLYLAFIDKRYGATH